MALTTLQDHNLDFNISLVKRVRRLDKGIFKYHIETIQELPQSAVNELEITDCLLYHGLKGTAILNNKFGALDQLKLLAKSSDDLFLSIQIVDPELAETNIPARQRVVGCLAKVGPVAEAAANIEDNVVALEFEEAFIAEMKNTSWHKFYLNYHEQLQEFSVIDLIRVFSQQVSDLYEGQKVYETHEDLVSFQFDKTIKDSLEGLVDENNRGPSVYNIFQRLLERTTTSGSPDIHHLPLFRFTNRVLEDPFKEIDYVEVNRKMEVSQAFTDRHREFIREAAEDGLQHVSSVKAPGKGVKSTNYYGDVYLEKFTVGPLAQISHLGDPNTNWTNTIESFNINRPNVFQLKNTHWVNYQFYPGTKNDPGKTEVSHTLYAEALNNFAINELGLDGVANGGLNLPMLNPKTMSMGDPVYRNGDFKVASNVSEAHWSNRQVKNSLYYKLTKSFITLNETCQFECKGRIYRQPGKFIWINESDWDKVGFKTAVEGDVNSLLEKLWYVNSVTHKFSYGEYTTEILANRFFGNRTPSEINALIQEHRQYIKGEKGRKEQIQEQWDKKMEALQRQQNNKIYGRDTAGFTDSNVFQG